MDNEIQYMLYLSIIFLMFYMFQQMWLFVIKVFRCSTLTSLHTLYLNIMVSNNALRHDQKKIWCWNIWWIICLVHFLHVGYWIWTYILQSVSTIKKSHICLKMKHEFVIILILFELINNYVEKMNIDWIIDIKITYSWKWKKMLLA